MRIHSLANHRVLQFAIGALLLMSTVSARAQIPWPRKTGPNANGTANASDTKGLPLEWNEAEGKNIAWKTKLEGSGHSTPVIGYGKVWLTSATEDGTKQYVYCIDSDSGKIVHHKLLFENAEPEPLGNSVNSYASPTCFLAGDGVYVHFGTYGTAKLDRKNAQVIWQRRDINCRHFRGPGSSPELFGETLVLTFDGIDQQYLTALNKNTGETIWRTDRTTDYGDLDENGKPHREGDLRKAYSTPAFAKVGDQVHVISVGSRAAFGYDLSDGKELWTIPHDDYNAAAQPLIFEGSAILNTGSRGANLISIRLKPDTRGDVTKSHVNWNRTKGNSRLSFPVLYDGHVYSLTDNGVLSCIDAITGKDVWTGRVGGDFVASPLIANKLIYVADQRGRTTVIRTGDKFQVAAKNVLDEGGKASLAIADGALFLRSSGHLYKLAKH